MRRPETAHRRYRRQIREAALRSTGTELLILEALEHAHRAGRLTTTEASERLRRLLQEQYQREYRRA